MTPCGFIALIPVLIIGLELISLALLTGSEVFNLRYRVLQTEYAAEASAAARTCALDVVRRFRFDPAQVTAPETVLLNGGHRCIINDIICLNDVCKAYTSAVRGAIVSQWLTTIRLEYGEMVSAESMEI